MPVLAFGWMAASWTSEASFRRREEAKLPELLLTLLPDRAALEEFAACGWVGATDALRDSEIM